MDSPAAIRRRKRRRVANENRKRAPRACDRCKARKGKCIETAAGACERCLQNALPCHFDRPLSPALKDQASLIESPVAASVTATELSPENQLAEKVVWPRFLSRLREAFSLDTQPVEEEQDLINLQTQMTRPALSPDELRRLRAAIDAFPPRQVANFLLSVCMIHGTDNFFYFDQAKFTDEIDQFYTTPNSPLRADSSFICLALAAFALGSQWTTLEKPEGFDLRNRPSDDDDPGRIFYNQAKTLVPDIIDRSNVRAIQAVFVIGVYLLPASAIGSSYVYMGLALRKALASDLHIDNSDDTSISDIEKEVRRRLWWSIYSLERCTTIKLNRPRSVLADIITTPLPSHLPSLDSTQRFDNHQHQIAYAKLLGISDRAAEPAIWQQADDDDEVAVYIESELQEWKRNLPPEFTLDKTDPQNSSYRAIFHLYLQYYYTWIAVGKVSVVTVVQAYLRCHFGTPSSASMSIDERVSDQAKKCIKAANKMLRLFESIKRTGNLTRFSFTDFQGCSIATIVVILSGIIEKHSEYEARVDFGLDCLRRMAEGNLTAKIGVRFVEAVRSITNEALEKLSRLQEATPRPERDKDSHAESYNMWAEWLARADAIQHGTSGQITPAERTSVTDTTMGQARQESVPALPAWGTGLAVAPLSGPALDSAIVDATLEAEQICQFQPMASADMNFHAMLHNDDQTFLMGLTGFDVLDFSGFDGSCP